MAAANKLSIIKPEKRVGRRNEIGVVNDFNPVALIVDQVGLFTEIGNTIFFL